MTTPNPLDTRTYGLALAALDYCDSQSLAVIEVAYYDGWHPMASDARIRPGGLNKRLQDSLPRDDNPPLCGYPSRIEAFAAAAEALGLSPVDTTPPGMVLVPVPKCERTPDFLRLWTDPTTKSAGRPCDEIARDISALAAALSQDNHSGAAGGFLTAEQTAGRAEVLRLMKKSVERWPQGEMTPNIQEWIQLLEGTADWFKPEDCAPSKGDGK